jgi:type II restriction enzyme
MSDEIIRSIERRKNWVKKIKNLEKDFIYSSDTIKQDLKNEINDEGISALIDHIRICQYIPEEYIRDSFEEKLYAKYTDYVISLAFEELGISSIVLGNRSNSPDIISDGVYYKFITDVKSMRISRTAKNQKDFKVNSISNWKDSAQYGLLISPLSHYPRRSSEIYRQAVKYSVCLLSYSHISLLLNYKKIFEEYAESNKVLGLLFSMISDLDLDRSSTRYWSGVHNILFKQNIFQDVNVLDSIWASEMIIMNKIIFHIKEESITVINNEISRLDTLSLEEAILELKDALHLNTRRKAIKSHSNLLLN